MRRCKFDMLPRSLFAAFCLSLVSSMASAQSHGLRFGPEPRLEVLPVLFVPSDNKAITAQAIQKISNLVYAHLELLQRRYQELLKTDTFKIAEGGLNVYYSTKPHSYYHPLEYGQSEKEWERFHLPGVHGSELAVKELLDWKGENRYGSRTIYLMLYARPGAAAGAKNPRWASARPFNGLPNSGGGGVALELSSLLSDVPYTFQATLAHELSHAFGLSHANCYGYSQITSKSLMAYNPRNKTSGLMPSAGVFNPEDYFVLSQNKLAFPNFRYVEAIHNPQSKAIDRIESCYQTPVGPIIGEFRSLPLGSGWELYWDGKRISAGDAEFYSPKFKRGNCRWNKATHTDQKVECRIDGKDYDPGPEPNPPDLAGAWCEDTRELASVAQTGTELTFAARGISSKGRLESNDHDVYTMIFADDWDQGLPALIAESGLRLNWANGRRWSRGPCQPDSGGPFTARIVAKNSGKCLRVPGFMKSTGGTIHQWQCGADDDQKWEFSTTDDGYYTIKVRHDGYCMDIVQASPFAGAAAWQWECHGTDNQKFKLTLDANGFYTIAAKHSGLCLDIAYGLQENGAVLIQWTCHGGDSQKFRLAR